LAQVSVNSPLSPFFGFAGVLLLAFGILWNVLTAGGQFANQDSPGFPRASRHNQKAPRAREALW
jgi:hypothetical protein